MNFRIDDTVMVTPNYDEVDSSLDVFRGKVGKIIEITQSLEEEPRVMFKVQFVEDEMSVVGNFFEDELHLFDVLRRRIPGLRGQERGE